jgi:DNA-binding transcriptional MerR regulator
VGSSDKGQKNGWNYSDKEYIKLFRRLLKWEWYTDVNTKVLFIHCLLKANWKDGSWHGYTYKRGQFITSLASLSRETGLTVKEVRTALKHLERTGEVASWHDSKIRIITVISYDQYQQAGKPTGKQRASEGQQIEEYIRIVKNIKNIKKLRLRHFRKTMTPTKRKDGATIEHLRI